MKLLDGTMLPDSGDIVRQTGATVTRLEQEVPSDVDGSTFDGARGRWGSVVWLVARLTPSIGDKSPGVLILLCAGTYALIG